VGVLVDMKDLDVSVSRAASGDFGDLVVDVTVTGALHVREVPADLRDRLGGLDLGFLSSDGLRLLLDRGIVSTDELRDLEGALLRQVSDSLGGSLGGAVGVKGGFDESTLAPTLVSAPVSADVPVVFQATASFRQPLAGGAPEPAAAIALYTQKLPLTLQRVEGLDTTYTVVLPRGLAVLDVAASGGEAQAGEAEDGRSQFTVTPTEESADVEVTMAVTPTFVLAKFWPVVLGAVVLLVLVVGTPIAILVLRRRHK